VSFGLWFGHPKILAGLIFVLDREFLLSVQGCQRYSWVLPRRPDNVSISRFSSNTSIVLSKDRALWILGNLLFTFLILTVVDQKYERKRQWAIGVILNALSIVSNSQFPMPDAQWLMTND
jgi:hypothetical protein